MQQNLFFILDQISQNDIRIDVLLSTNRWMCSVKLQNVTPESAVLHSQEMDGRTTYYITPISHIVTVRYEL